MEEIKSTNQQFDELYHQYVYLSISMNALQFALDSIDDPDDNFLEIRALKDFIFKKLGSISILLQSKTIVDEKIDVDDISKKAFQLCELTNDALKVVLIFSENIQTTTDNKNAIICFRKKVFDTIKNEK